MALQEQDKDDCTQQGCWQHTVVSGNAELRKTRKPVGVLTVFSFQGSGLGRCAWVPAFQGEAQRDVPTRTMLPQNTAPPCRARPFHKGGDGFLGNGVPPG